MNAPHRAPGFFTETLASSDPELFASITDEPVDAARVARALFPTGSGGGICALGSAEELEVGNVCNALEAAEAELGAAGAQYRSAKLTVDVTGDSTYRNRSANSVEMSRLHGSDPATQGSTEV